MKAEERINIDPNDVYNKAYFGKITLLLCCWHLGSFRHHTTNVWGLPISIMYINGFLFLDSMLITHRWSGVGYNQIKCQEGFVRKYPILTSARDQAIGHSQITAMRPMIKYWSLLGVVGKLIILFPLLLWMHKLYPFIRHLIRLSLVRDAFVSVSCCFVGF